MAWGRRPTEVAAARGGNSGGAREAQPQAAAGAAPAVEGVEQMDGVTWPEPFTGVCDANLELVALPASAAEAPAIAAAGVGPAGATAVAAGVAETVDAAVEARASR